MYTVLDVNISKDVYMTALGVYVTCSGYIHYLHLVYTLLTLGESTLPEVHVYIHVLLVPSSAVYISCIGYIHYLHCVYITCIECIHYLHLEFT